MTIIKCLGDEKCNILPELTLDEFNDKVQRGAHLVICDGFVVDIRKWIGVHPGGAKILESVIGTDITDDFHARNINANKENNNNHNDNETIKQHSLKQKSSSSATKSKSRLKGQMVIRNYSPIDGKIMKSFSILVKIYPNGPMSKHLNNRLIGFEIQARGPFDIVSSTTTTISY
ncbi:7326_t:CDS:2 [Entrophospora sp. SA101]|nr:7326_t:CDS:2 [Entrophospora sp. SA101]